MLRSRPARRAARAAPHRGTRRSSRPSGISCSTWPMRSPRERVISPDVGSKPPAMHLSSVDLPRPLAATMPRRSDASIARSRFSKSGTPSVTPRFLRLINAIVVLWSVRAIGRHSGRRVWLTCKFGCGDGSAVVTMCCAQAFMPGAALPLRADRKMRISDRLWSALQTCLQGVDGATLTMVTKERDHAALLSRRVVERF